MDFTEEKLQTQLKEWFAKLDLLEEKARLSGAEAKAKYEKMVAELRGKLKAVLIKLETVKQQSGSSAEIIQKEVEIIWSEAQRAIESITKLS